MPQMSPMFWFYLFLWMILYNYIMINMMFFISLNKINYPSNNNFKKINLNLN